MQVRELKRLLDGMAPEATVYVQLTDSENTVSILQEIETITPSSSTAFGVAVIIELED